LIHQSPVAELISWPEEDDDDDEFEEEEEEEKVSPVPPAVPIEINGATAGTYLSY